MSEAIDLSKYPLPPVIEQLDYEGMFTAFKARFTTQWEAARLKDPTLPAYDVDVLETDPVVIVGQAYSYLRLLDRARVNAAVKAVLPAYALGQDLDHVAARGNVKRLVVTPATDTTPAVYETDAQLLRRYQLSFDRPSAGSDRAYLYHAYTCWPQARHVACLGPETHGRRGEIHLVLLSETGEADSATIDAVNRYFQDGRRKPTTDTLRVVSATVAPYTAAITIRIPRGPDSEIVRSAAVAAVSSAADVRFYIGGQVPVSALNGAAYVPNVLRADMSGADIPPAPYVAPQMTALTVTVEIAS